MPARSTSSPALAVLRLAVLVMGLVGLGWTVEGLVRGRPGDPLVAAGLPASPLARLDRAFTEDGDARVARHLEANRPGSFELLAEVRRALDWGRPWASPGDPVLLGFHATAAETAGDPAAERDRKSALAFLGHLQLLLHPLTVEPMPALGPDWTPPPGLPLERLYVLDLDYPHTELFEALLERGPATSAGTLWVPREGAR